MGLGDQLIATGLARNAWSERGARVAFGAHGRIMWDKNSEEIFRHNPNILPPGNETRGKVEWVAFYKGNRGYNKQGAGCWIWNEMWRCTPGQLFFRSGETAAAARIGSGFVVVEPNVPEWKSSAANKRWPFERYQAVTDELSSKGYKVVQFNAPGKLAGRLLQGAIHVSTRSFRDAAAILKNAALYVGPEGGMHHAAAAVGTPAVVIFGGFIPPSVTGYEAHTNIPGSDRFCGSFNACPHCADAMKSISVETVCNAAKGFLKWST